MISTGLTKDIEAEIVFSMLPESSERLFLADNRTIGFLFNKEDLWEVKLWRENNEPDFAIGMPTRFFVEFEYPQSLFAYVEPGKEFEVWLIEEDKHTVIGKGIILELLNLEARAQENIENIFFRPSGEGQKIVAFIESFCGKAIYDEIDNLFYQKLKHFLQAENVSNYLWLWGKPDRSHAFVEFNYPKHMPTVDLLLPETQEPIWFLVDIDALYSGWFLYNATYTSIEKIFAKYKFSKYYIVAKDFSWLIRKVDRQFVAIGSDVEKKLKQYQSM